MVPIETLTAFVLDFVQNQLSKGVCRTNSVGRETASVHRAQGRFVDFPIESRIHPAGVKLGQAYYPFETP